MKLPSVKKVGIYYKWSNHKISTKTLELKPFEKSDMSPYLIHMTSENSILSILQSGEIGQGVITSTEPSQKLADWYDQKIVCFTETPIFSLDFFRYKSHKRWLKDLCYGIGFSKKALADKGVRPALYIDDEAIGMIANLKNSPEDSEELELFKKFAPLMTPLDHDKSEQGFMWEREWRFANSEAFIFNYSDIEIICCPHNEVQELTEVLGEFANNIKFIETWGAYEEMSEYLDSQKNSHEMKLVVNSTGIDELKSAHLELSQELSKLDAYKVQMERLTKHLSLVDETIPEIKKKITAISGRIERQEWLEEHCCICSNSFEEFSLKPYEWERDEDLDTWICIDCKSRTGM
ncbi:PHD finger domain-containing protein [Acinetobacter sp. GN11]